VKPRAARLSSLPYFADLEPQVLEAIDRIAVRRQYEPGEVVLLEGDPAPGIFAVETGWLKAIKVSLEGREQILRYLEPGEVFNAIGAFGDLPNSATVMALEPASVWILERTSFQELLERHPHIARIIMKNLARRVVQLVSLVEDLSLRTVEARLARYLIEQAELSLIVPRQRWATQAEIAARLGTVLDVLNRAMQRLAGEGLIRVERHQIHILDPEGLRERAMLQD
jgi:CRP-like cAMP-binding protein